jgi:hypothetical protein
MTASAANPAKPNGSGSECADDGNKREEARLWNAEHLKISVRLCLLEVEEWPLLHRDSCGLVSMGV